MRYALGVVLLAVFGCTPPPGAADCFADRDCHPPGSCVNGVCLPSTGGRDADTADTAAADAAPDADPERVDAEVDAGRDAELDGGPDASTVESCDVILRVSVGTGGVEGTGAVTQSVAISGDGRFVAFASDAPNLVALDHNNATDVFVHDVLTGTTARISVSSMGVEGNGPSGQVAPDILDLSISADGRFVLFTSSATNLIDGTTIPLRHLYLHDRREHLTEVVDVAQGGPLDGPGSPRGEIDGTGRFIVFQSVASNLVPGDGSRMDIFLRDRLSPANLVRLTDDSMTFKVEGFSDDGRFVLGTEGVTAFVLDRMISRTSTLPLFGPRELSMSDDARYIAFSTDAQLVPADTNPTRNRYLFDRSSGLSVALELDERGALVNNHALDVTDVSADGSRVAFSSFGRIEAADANVSGDVYVYHRSIGRARLISRNIGGAAAGGSSTPALSSDGRWVAFRSTASDLVSGDENGVADIFVCRVCDP